MFTILMLRKMVQLTPDTYFELIQKKHEYMQKEKKFISMDQTVKRLLKENGKNKNYQQKKDGEVSKNGGKKDGDTLCRLQKTNSSHNTTEMVMPRMLQQTQKNQKSGIPEKTPKKGEDEDGIHKNTERGIF